MLKVIAGQLPVSGSRLRGILATEPRHKQRTRNVCLYQRMVSSYPGSFWTLRTVQYTPSRHPRQTSCGPQPIIVSVNWPRLMENDPVKWKDSTRRFPRYPSSHARRKR